MYDPSPILPWLGGKRRLADRLLALFPAHECYVEAFAGSAALYFLRPTPASVEVINDRDGELINLYRVVQHHLDEFMRQFRWALSSREMFRWLQETRPETLTDIQRAARFFYLQQHAFGGKTTGQTFGTATTTPPINLLRIEESLSAAHLRLAGTYIEHLPWLDCVTRYDREHTFEYLDPPYWQTAGYSEPFEFKEYGVMADWMRRARGRVMVSINDHPDIRRVFDGLPMLEVEIRYAVSGNRGSASTSRELVITNWDTGSACELFGAGFWSENAGSD